MAAVGAEGPEAAALAQLESFDEPPATPRTPKSGGMTLRSGNTPRRTPLRNSVTRGLTPRRTPRRSPRIKAQQQNSHLTAEDALALEFGEAYSGFLDNIDEFVTTDPSLIEVSNSGQWPQLNILQMNETGKFSSFTSKDNPFFGSVSSPALHKLGHEPVNTSQSAAEGYLTHQHFTGAGLSPVLAGKLMSPGIDLTRLRRKTGLTPRTALGGPSAGGASSPRLGPFPSPSPYRLRSASPRSSFLAREADVAALGMGDDFYKPRGSAKRPLLTDPPLYTSPSSKHNHLQPSADSSNQGVSSSAKKLKKTPKPKRTTSSAPKRGEYRCGKCGFFPKKSKHNCLLEKAKRQNSGQPTIGSTGNASNTAPKSQDDPSRTKMNSDPMLSYFNSNH